MAIVNPTPADFISSQERALDYQQYRSSSDILRAVAEFYKVSVYQSTDPGKLNYITTGFMTEANITTDQIIINVTKGAGVFDNQPVIIYEDFEFQYDRPSNDVTYYVYLFYKYVEEYPPNYAYIQIFTNEVTEPGYMLLSKVNYNSSTGEVTVDLTPRYENAAEEIGGGANPQIINDDTTITDNENDQFFMVDTSSGSVTITLPNDPNANMKMIFFDMSGTFDIHPLIVQAPTGYTIDGQDHVTFDVKKTYAQLQLLDPSNNTNWYVTLVTSPYIDGGVY